MAVTNNGNRIKFGSVNDAVTGSLVLQAILYDHTAAGSCVIQDTASKEIITLRNSASVLSAWVFFPKGLKVEGLKVTTMAAGTVTIYLM